MKRWFQPLQFHLREEDGSIHWLNSTSWMHGDAFPVGTPNGYMQKETIRFVIDHVDRHARKFVSGEKPLLLLLDGHSSRNGYEWLKLAQTKRIEVVQSPNNTSHFLQPNDATVNRAFQRAVRSTRDYIASKSIVSFGEIAVKLRLGVSGYRSVTADVVKESFRRTGIWPMDFRFVVWDEAAWEETHGDGGQHLRKYEVERDAALVRDIRLLVKGDGEQRAPTQTLDFILDLMRRRRKFRDSVLDFMESQCSLVTVSSAPQRRGVLRHGGPALYMTNEEVVAHREEMEKDKEKEAKKRAADRLKRQAVRAERKAGAPQSKEKESDKYSSTSIKRHLKSKNTHSRTPKQVRFETRDQEAIQLVTTAGSRATALRQKDDDIRIKSACRLSTVARVGDHVSMLSGYPLPQTEDKCAHSREDTPFQTVEDKVIEAVGVRETMEGQQCNGDHEAPFLPDTIIEPAVLLIRQSSSASTVRPASLQAADEDANKVVSALAAMSQQSSAPQTWSGPRDRGHHHFYCQSDSGNHIAGEGVHGDCVRHDGTDA